MRMQMQDHPRGARRAHHAYVTTWQVVRADSRLELVGELRTHEARRLWRTLTDAAKSSGPQLDLDLARTTAIDSVVVVLLVELRGILGARGTKCELVHVPAAIVPVVHLYGGDTPLAAKPPAITKEGAVSRLGARVERLAHQARDPVSFTGDLMTTMVQTVRRPRSANWRAVPALIQQTGAEAIPIVIVLLFLVGFTIALQSTPSLQLLGANIYVADLVSVSATRELAPLMGAIIITGRSGAGFAAEIGTMRISEEIDALRTMGIAPMPYLVLPRVVALAIVAPMLVMIGGVVAVIGGLVVAVVSLGLTPQAYIGELQTTLIPSDVWTGLIKSSVFGITIALIGCQQGLAARGAAAGVGRRTTATVVICLFAIVVLDTLMTVFFRRLDV